MDDYIDPCIAEITKAAKVYIEANDAVRRNPCGYKSCHGRPDDPVWKEYYKLNEAYRKAYSDLWEATDVEYAEDGFRDKVWEWRYWKVMARKCCWYQKSIITDHMAAKTMRRLHLAEAEMMAACGLSDYKSPCYYLEEMFPNLKSK